MTDVRELLRSLAGKPHGDLDLEGIVQVAQARRRRRRLIGSGLIASILLFGAGGGIIAFAGSDEPHLEVGADTSPSAPADVGLSVDLPAGWNHLPLDVNSVPSQVLAVGTADRPAGGEIQACQGPSIESPRPAAYVLLYEYGPGDALVSPSGQILTTEEFWDRPEAFTSAIASGGTCESTVAAPPVEQTPETTAPDVTTTSLVDPGDALHGMDEPTSSLPPVSATDPRDHRRDGAFRDGGRLFAFRIVTLSDVSEQLLGQAFAVLTSLRVEPLAATTTSTQAADVASNTPVEGDVEFAITDAINAAFGTPSSIGLVDSVEGGHPFANPDDAKAAGDRAASADEITQRAYEASKSGAIIAKINWVEMDGPERAHVSFELITNGNPITATTIGYAVLENGQWRLSRATFCEVVGRGGINACPS